MAGRLDPLKMSSGRTRRRNTLKDYASARAVECYGPVAIPALVFAVIFVFVFLLHVPLLRLPYFWDEAGYYVPAARDILLSGSLIPHSTVSNAHPPLVMAWLALWWKVVGYAPRGYADGHVSAGRVFASGIISPSRSRGQFIRCNRGHAVHGGLSGILCAEFFGPGRLGRRGTYLLGAVGLRGRANAQDNSVVLAGRAGQGDRDPGSVRARWMGDRRPVCE